MYTRLVEMNGLKASEIKSLPDGIYRDEGNLYFRVRKNGSIREFLYRGSVNGKQTYRSLGSLKTLSLKEARQKAKTYVLVPIIKIPTFNNLWKEALDEVAFQKQWVKEASYKSNQRYLERTLPTLGSLKVTLITKEDILSYLKPLWKENAYEGERTRSILEAVFDRFISKKLITENPAAWDKNLDGDLPHWKDVHEVEHRKALKWDLVPDLMSKVFLSQNQGRYLLMFVVATALRITECRTLKWEYIESNKEMGEYFNIPAENRKKNRKKKLSNHILPITPLMKQILSLVPKTSEYIFTNTNNEVFGITCCNHLLQHQYKIDATVHGFRTCFRTWGAIKKQDFASCELILSHSLCNIGTQSTRCYFGTDMYDERKKILTRWNKYIFSKVKFSMDSVAERA